MRAGRVVAGTLALVFVVSACVDSEREPLRAVLPAEDVLIPPEFPRNRWPDQEWLVDGTSDLTEVYSESAWEYPAKDGMSRGWYSGNYRTYIGHTVSVFETVDSARDYFEDADPRSDEDFPLRVDASDSYATSPADNARIYCRGARGSSDACGLWIYWARYGQYVLKWRYFAGVVADDTENDTLVQHAGISIEEFLNYVREVDAYTERALESR